MKQFLLSTLFVVNIAPGVIAQDAIYMASGNRIENAQLIGVSENKVSFTVPGRSTPLTFQRPNVLVAFSRSGNFLIISELGNDLTLAEQRLRAYQSAPARLGNRDYLIKAVPLTVISAEIIYQSDAVINYKTRDGKSASISKGELIGILYRDGRHEFLREIKDVEPLLSDVKKQIEADIAAPAVVPPTVATTPPVQPAAPEPAKPITTEKTADVPEPIKSQTTETELTAPASSITESSKLSLSESDYQLYRKKALQRVDEFVSYLNVITNKKLSTSEKDNAIAQAAKLFMPAATIEVTSTSRPGARRYPIQDYLTRLKLLPYTSTKIEWSEVQFIKELSQAADGNYYGVIAGQQTFIGYGTQTVYSDVVRKNVRVKLERYQVQFNGADITKWNLLLGSIGVSAN